MSDLPPCYHRITGPENCYLANPDSYAPDDVRRRNTPPPCGGHCTHPNMKRYVRPGYNPPCWPTIRDNKCPEGYKL